MSPPRPHRRRSRPALWFLPLATLLLLLQMPAHRLGGLIESACAGQCRLAELSGPWWAGQGRLFARTPDGEGWLPLGDAGWRTLPGGGDWLAIAMAGGELVVDRQFNLRIDGLQLPAALVLGQPAWRLPATGWQGSLELSAATFRRDGRRPGESQGRLIWRNAASDLLENHPLGDLQADWHWHPEAGLRADLAGGLPGEIALSGQLQGQSLHLEIGLDGASRPALERYLKSFADAGAQPGQYTLAWTVR